MKLIVEQADMGSLEIISEASENGGKKNYKIKGVFLQSEKKNKNGRVYSKPLLEREVAKYNKEKIADNRGMGELDHPPSPTINLERVSHLVESLQMDGNNGVGTARILNTPMGNIASSLLESGVKLGVSTRGVGSLTGGTVNEDYNLIAVDLVADPSAHEAFVEGILENKDYIIDGDKIIESAVENLEQELSDKGSKAIYAGMQEFLRTVKRNFKENR